VNPSDLDVAMISHVIQLSIAPVFLLTGVSAMLGVMANRLARVIDRGRYYEERWKGLTAEEQAEAREELATLFIRARISSWAINACTAAALLTCVLIATLFVDAFIGNRLRWFVAVLFVMTMVALILGLAFFLREVYIATHTMRIGPIEREMGASVPGG
jgi:uncharacterized membrane protein YGL010W